MLLLIFARSHSHATTLTLSRSRALGRHHYGNPKYGCRDDEDAIDAGTGLVCAPKVGDGAQTRAVVCDAMKAHFITTSINLIRPTRTPMSFVGGLHRW